MDDRRLAALARRRNNVLTLDDAVHLGLTRAALSRHAARHGWPRPSRGVYLLPGTTLDHRRALQVVLCVTGRERVVVGGLTAAYLWGMITRPPPHIRIIVPLGRHPPRVDHLRLHAVEQGTAMRLRVALRHSRTLTRGDRTVHGGIPLTTPARTIIDCAAELPLVRLRNLVIDARQRRVLRLDDLAEIHDRVTRYPGRPHVRQVLRDLTRDDCDSPLEWDFRAEARRRGFRPYPAPFPFRCSDGRVIHIDVAFPEAWVAVECDGFGAHAERASLTRDHLRQNRAVADGWRPFRVDTTRLEQDADVLFRELSALLAAPVTRAPAVPASDSIRDRRAGRGR